MGIWGGKVSQRLQKTRKIFGTFEKLWKEERRKLKMLEMMYLRNIRGIRGSDRVRNYNYRKGQL